MRVIKMLGAVLLSFAALVSVGANAQTQNVPVSCSWVLVSSSSGPSGADVNLKCQESGGAIAATKVINYRTNAATLCSISLSSGVFNSGSCENPNLYRTAVVTSQCNNAGAYIGSGCANSMTGSAGFGAAVQQLCGVGCPVRYENLGGNHGCSSQSPYLKAYCK